MNQLTIFCLVLGIVSWYYFNKFQDSEKEYNKLYKRFEQVYIENQKVKSRIKDLQSYKNDVSKTFKILDNELVMINDHLKKQNENVTPERQRPPLPPRPPAARSFYMRNIPNDNVSLLTPDLLTSLFNMNTFTDVVDTLPIANPGRQRDTFINPIRQGIVNLFGQGPLQTLYQESAQQQQQEELAFISKEQESVQQQQQEELALISKEQESVQQQQQEEVGTFTEDFERQGTFTEDFDKRQGTVKLDLNIDMDKIGRSDKIGDNYDRYII
jgi:hypothetical protein